MLLAEHVGISATGTQWSMAAGDAILATVRKGNWGIVVGETDGNLHAALL